MLGVSNLGPTMANAFCICPSFLFFFLGGVTPPAQVAIAQTLVADAQGGSVWHCHFCKIWFPTTRHDVFHCHLEGGRRFQQLGPNPPWSKAITEVAHGTTRAASASATGQPSAARSLSSHGQLSTLQGLFACAFALQSCENV